MNKFFKDDTSEVQEIPLDTMKHLFPKFLEAPAEYQKVANKWIVMKSGKTPEGLSYQVAVQNVVALANFIYHVFVYRIDDILVAHLPVRAVNPLPPVAEKYKGLDYFDWLEIQASLVKFLKEKNYKPIDIDTDPEGKLVYSTKETPQEVVEKMNKGESYTIVSMPAATFIERMQELHKKKEEETSRIITPDSELVEEKKIIVP
jgi:hypothetical protein